VEDLTTLSEGELWSLQRKVMAEQARRELAAKVEERDARVERNAKIAAFGTLLADLLAPTHHSKSCNDENRDGYDGECTRCKLLYLARHPEFGDVLEFRFHADYEPVELPSDAPPAPPCRPPVLSRVLADRFRLIRELPSSLRLSQGDDQDNLCVAITPWTVPAASLMKRGVRYSSAKHREKAATAALAYVADRLVRMLGSDYPLLHLGLQYARAVTARGAADEAAIIEFGFEGRHYGLVVKERKDVEGE
jgi:hypothetical protein